jgi:N-acetylmuramic acid 6-phosphate etherase
MLQTEQALNQFAGLDTWDDEAIMAALVVGHVRAVEAVAAACPVIGRAANTLAGRLSSGGRLVYAGAGSSIGQGVLDGAELPGTFGLPSERLRFVIAGGRQAVFAIDNAADDDIDAARHDAEAVNFVATDALIALSASGSTKYTVAIAQKAKAAGALVIAIVNNLQSALAQEADHEICLGSGPEVIAGSTRMAAGTAQKCALNLLSTLTHIRLGAVHDGMMVNVRADNEKLKARARSIVAKIAQVDDACAHDALDAAAGEVKPAVLVCAGAQDLEAARALLAGSHGNLRRALERLAAS